MEIVELEMDPNAEEVRIPLRKKITAYEDELSELPIKRPTGKEFEKFADVELAKITYGNMFKMVMVACNLPRTSVHQMDAADVMKAGMVIVNFLGSSLPTGGNSALT